MKKKTPAVKAAEVPKDKLSAALVIASINVSARPHFTKLKKIEVVDNKTYDLMAEKVASLKALAKTAKEKQASLIEPLEKVIVDIKELFRPFLDKVEQAEKEAKDDMLAYRKKVEAKKEKVVLSLSSGNFKLSTAANKLNELEIVSEHSSTRKQWELVEIDANVTPREYLVPDTKKIKEAFKAGKTVLGWKWEQKENIAI